MSTNLPRACGRQSLCEGPRGLQNRGRHASCSQNVYTLFSLKDRLTSTIDDKGLSAGQWDIHSALAICAGFSEEKIVEEVEFWQVGKEGKGFQGKARGGYGVGGCF